MLKSGPAPEFLKPFVVTRAGLCAPGDDVDASAPLRIDPTRTSSELFLTALERLDELAYAPKGIQTPRWALYDCAELPGAVLGLCAPPTALPQAARDAFEQPKAEWLPVTFLMAVPTLFPTSWLVHSICDLAEVMHTGTRDLRPETMRFAYPWLGARRITGICQWNSDRLALHTRWSSLRLSAAWLTSHDYPATCVFHYDPDASRERYGSMLDGDAFALDPDDTEALKELQLEIERGAAIDVVDVGTHPSERKIWLSRSAAT